MAESELIRDDRAKKFPLGFIAGLVFIGLFFFLMYTSFYDADLTKKISGNFISSPRGSSFQTISVNGEFSLPDELIVDSYVSTLRFKLKEPLRIVIGDQHIDLETDASFAADSFEGSFIISGGKILYLAGTAAQVFANGVPLKDKTGKAIIVEADEIAYTYAFFDDVSLSKIDYTPSSGVLHLNDDAVVVRFKNEPLYLKEYQGSLEMSRNYLRLKGVADEVDIEKLLKKSSLNST